MGQQWDSILIRARGLKHIKSTLKLFCLVLNVEGRSTVLSVAKQTEHRPCRDLNELFRRGLVVVKVILSRASLCARGHCSRQHGGEWGSCF